jgi:hypothetical protein
MDCLREGYPTCGRRSSESGPLRRHGLESYTRPGIPREIEGSDRELKHCPCLEEQMRIQVPLIVASLLLLSQALAWAGDPKTIPVEIAKNLKKGKKLSLVWKAPDFDGSKGCVLGRLTNESDDDAQVVLDSFPGLLRPAMRADAPYTLHLAVVSMKSSARHSVGGYIASVEVEGQVANKGGALVAAFDTFVTNTTGGTERDNIRMAVREISFQIFKDLFSVGLPSQEKPSAVIVAAAVSEKQPEPVPAKEQPSAIIVAAPKIQISTPVPVATPPMPQAPAPTAEVPVEKTPASPAPVTEVIPVKPSEAVPPSTPSPSAAISKPSTPIPQTPLSTPLPASIVEGMKKGAAFDKLWISPVYDRSQGFSIGEVRYFVDERNAGVSGYLPDALAEISKQDSPFALHLGIVELYVRQSANKQQSTVKLGVEGRLVARDGTVVAAFSTRESRFGMGDTIDDCRTLARKVVLGISKELR